MRAHARGLKIAEGMQPSIKAILAILLHLNQVNIRGCTKRENLTDEPLASYRSWVFPSSAFRFCAVLGHTKLMHPPPTQFK